MKYFSLIILCIFITACSTDIVDSKVASQDPKNDALECHNTIPNWQTEELLKVRCLNLPISNQDFSNIKKFDNGMFDVKGDSRFVKIVARTDGYIPLGLIPYDSEETFLISFSNDQAEDGYPNQSFHITKIRKDNEQDSMDTLGIYPLGLIDYDFQDIELIELGIDPNEFADIDYDRLGQENITIDDICEMSFNIDINWDLIRSYSCQNTLADPEIINSFNQQFGFNHELTDGFFGIGYERVALNE